MKKVAKIGLIVGALLLIACLITGYVFMFMGDSMRATQFLFGSGVGGIIAFVFGSVWILLGGD